MIIGNGEISLGIVKPGLGHLYPGTRVQSGLSSSVKREKNELYEEILGKLGYLHIKEGQRWFLYGDRTQKSVGTESWDRSYQC